MKTRPYGPGLLLAWEVSAHAARVANFARIEPEHLIGGLLKVLDAKDSIIASGKLESFDLGAFRSEMAILDSVCARISLDVTAARRRLRTLLGHGTHRAPASGPMSRSNAARHAFDRAGQIAQTANDRAVTAPHLLQAICESPSARIRAWLAEFDTSARDLVHLLARANAPRPGEGPTPTPPHLRTAASTPPAGGAPAPAGVDATPLDPVFTEFGRDLTALAAVGAIDAAIGRRDEMLQVVRTLSRRTKSNPALVGEAGVGKTAIVEGLAVRIATRNVVEALWDHRIVEIRMSTLVAGAKYRGDFEARLTRLIEAAERDDKLILFLDELHSLVGAGGDVDAASILKPALARGALRCIGATTFDEYRREVESDPALARRFVRIRVDEPDEPAAIEILRGLRARFETHHGVRIEDAALVAAVSLSRRYVKDRRLPDKAIDLIDEACAMVKVATLSHVGQPPVAGAASAPTTAFEPVGERVVAEVVAEKTGIDVTELTGSGAEKFLGLAARLGERVFGQDAALAAVSSRLRLAGAGLRDTARPMAVFLFLGPTGVGKTWVARTLAELLFPGDAGLVRIDMSEYLERHAVARLVGAPPGYVGHDEEGQLTGPLGRHPYSLVLLDEVEKAHPDVWDIFLQVFDDGRLTDGRGRTVDASHAVFVMTSNVGARTRTERAIGFTTDDDPAAPGADRERYLAALRSTFRPELINRIDEIVIFDSLDEAGIAAIARRELDIIRGRLAARGVGFEIDDDAFTFLAHEGFSADYGARHMRRTVEDAIAAPLSAILLEGRARDGDTVRVRIAAGNLVVEAQAAPGERGSG